MQCSNNLPVVIGAEWKHRYFILKWICNGWRQIRSGLKVTWALRHKKSWPLTKHYCHDTLFFFLQALHSNVRSAVTKGPLVLGHCPNTQMVCLPLRLRDKIEIMIKIEWSHLCQIVWRENEYKLVFIITLLTSNSVHSILLNWLYITRNVE